MNEYVVMGKYPTGDYLVCCAGSNLKHAETVLEKVKANPEKYKRDWKQITGFYIDTVKAENCWWN